MRSSFEELVLAYRRGRVAAKAGKSLKDNPYPDEETCGHTRRGEWSRGWAAGKAACKLAVGVDVAERFGYTGWRAVKLMQAHGCVGR